MIRVDEIDTCVCVEEAMCWGLDVSFSTNVYAKLVGMHRTACDLRSDILEEEL